MLARLGRGNIQKSYYFKIFRIYFLFLIPIIVISLISYSYIKQRYIGETNNANQSNLNSIASNIEKDIFELERLSYLVIKNMHRDNIENLTLDYASQDPTNIYKLQKTQSTLISLKSAKENIHRVLIHLPKSNRLISDDGVYKVGEYYDIFPNYRSADDAFIHHNSGSIEYLKVLPTVRLGNDRKAEAIENNYTDVIPITISYRTFEGINANVLMNIRESYISGLLNNTNMIPGTNTLVMDGAGNLVSHTDHSQLYAHDSYQALLEGENSAHAAGSKIRINGKKYILFGHKLSFPNWTVYSLVPQGEYYRQLDFIKVLLVFINVALLGSGLIAAHFFSNRLYSPIRNFIEILSNKETPIESGEIEFINENVKALKHKLEKIKPLIQENIVKNIVLYGDQSVTEQELRQLLGEHDIRMDLPYYLAGVCQLYYSRSFHQNFPEEVQKSIRKKIAAIFASFVRGANPGHNMFIELEDGRYLIVINSDEPRLRERLLAAFDEINDLIQADRDYLKLTLAVSEPLQSLLALADAYPKISASLHFARLNKDEFLVDETALNRNPTLHLPPHFEEKLRNVISYGYAQDIDELVDQVLDSNLGPSPTPFMFNRVVNIFMYEIEKVLQHYGIHIDIGFEYRSDPLLQQYDKDGARAFFLSLLADMNRLIQQHNPSANKKALLEEYIEANYASENLDLQVMADTLKFNPNYLSRLFKEQTGKTFTDYVTEVRMNKAKTLIQESDMSIEEIGRLVGIVNRRTFNRSFKKATGASPTLYRIIQK